MPALPTELKSNPGVLCIVPVFRSPNVHIMATAMDTATPPVRDLEYALVEAWLDEHPDFVDDYFLRKATKELVDLWMLLHMTPSSVEEF